MGLLYLFLAPTPPAPSGGNEPTFPDGGSVTPGTTTEDTTPIQTYAGEVIEATDFIHNGETVADVENPGSYVLAGSVGYCLANGTCPEGAPTTEFNISYNTHTDFFNIILLKEPLGSARSGAEQFLRERLSLSNDELCSLRYFLGTPYWINEHYADKNLGFSFCPGATALPE